MLPPAKLRLGTPGLHPAGHAVAGVRKQPLAAVCRPKTGAGTRYLLRHPHVWPSSQLASASSLKLMYAYISFKLPVTDKSPDYTGAHRNTHVSTRPVTLFPTINTSERRSGQLRV